MNFHLLQYWSVVYHMYKHLSHLYTFRPHLQTLCVFECVCPSPPRFFIKKHTTKRHDSHRWPVVHRWYRSVHATWRFRSRRGKLPTWRYSDLPGETRFREAQTLQHQPPTWSLNNKRYTVIISVMKVTFFVLLRWTMVIQKPWLLWWSKIFIVIFLIHS